MVPLLLLSLLILYLTQLYCLSITLPMVISALRTFPLQSLRFVALLRAEMFCFHFLLGFNHVPSFEVFFFLSAFPPSAFPRPSHDDPQVIAQAFLNGTWSTFAPLFVCFCRNAPCAHALYSDPFRFPSPPDSYYPRGFLTPVSKLDLFLRVLSAPFHTLLLPAPSCTDFPPLAGSLSRECRFYRPQQLQTFRRCRRRSFFINARYGFPPSPPIGTSLFAFANYLPSARRTFYLFCLPPFFPGGWYYGPVFSIYAFTAPVLGIVLPRFLTNAFEFEGKTVCVLSSFL